MDGVVSAWPKTLLRIEGLAILGSCMWAYARTGLSWWTFAGALLLPDLGMLGFAANTRVGAATYNLFHTETPAVLLLCAGYARGSTNITAAALVWLAHINMDRAICAGLKYGDGFTHTHLSSLKQSKPAEQK